MTEKKIKERECSEKKVKPKENDKKGEKENIIHLFPDDESRHLVT